MFSEEGIQRTLTFQESATKRSIYEQIKQNNHIQHTNNLHNTKPTKHIAKFTQNACTHGEVLEGDGVVGVDDELLSCEGDGLLELGGDVHADGAQQLQLGARDVDHGQEAVHVVHGQGEHFLLTPLLLAHLKFVAKKCKIFIALSEI